MKTKCSMQGSMGQRWKSTRGWGVLSVALISFGVGSLVAAHLTHPKQVSADNNRVFELRVYHTVPGKVLELESRFRETTSKVLAKHDLKVVGYWVPEGAPAWENTFIFVVAHANREEAKKNWDAMFSDPEFQEVVKAEQANKLVEKVDVTYMRPTDFSPMK
jgi:NIPSNAP